MEAARYRLVPRRPTGKAQLQRAVAELLDRERSIVTSMKKGRTVERDIRPLVLELRVIEEGEHNALEAVLEAKPGRTCRPDDLIRALFPDRGPADFAVTRTACLTRSRTGGLVVLR
jgi:hypothetical protein